MMSTYTPIVKGKVNDIKAVGKVPASLASTMVPLIELISPNVGQTFDRSADNFCANLGKHCADQLVAVDLHSISPYQLNASGDPALEWVFASMRGRGLPFVPVSGLDHEPELWPRVAKIAKQEGRGLVFRVRTEDLDTGSDAIDELLDLLALGGISSSQVTLLIDLSSLHDFDAAALSSMRDKAQNFIDAVLSASNFRLISIVGSSMPVDVAKIPKDGVAHLPRKELPIWLELCDSFPTVGLAFGDYGIVHPNFSDKSQATNANAKVRYTDYLGHHIFRGCSVRQGKKFQQFPDLALKLLATPHYLGRDFSFGDDYAWRCANGEASCGNLGTWVEVDMNHHLVYVSSQLRKIEARALAGASLEDLLSVPA